MTTHNTLLTQVYDDTNTTSNIVLKLFMIQFKLVLITIQREVIRQLESQTVAEIKRKNKNRRNK